MISITGDTNIGIDALVKRNDGSVIRSASETEQNEWVSATQTRNILLGDPILDWLDLYGEKQGFLRDSSLQHYDARTDFTKFMLAQARRFETAVVELLSESYRIATISRVPGFQQVLTEARNTFAEMCEGAKIIYQGVLLDPEHMTYGSPDLLIRSDILAQLFPEAINQEEALYRASDLPNARWHYRVIDIKFKTLGMLANGELDNAGTSPAFKVQLAIYNQALGRVQGFEPPTAYLLGRGWRQGSARGSNCLERLGEVSQTGTLARKRPIKEAMANSISWLHRVRTQGGKWNVLPNPSVPELYPNCNNDEDWPWHYAKKNIAKELEDLTLLWAVGPQGRAKAHDAGIRRWSNPDVTPEIVGVTGAITAQILGKILEVNRDVTGPPVLPERVQAAREEWHNAHDLEFFVDFETVSDLADDFSQLPEKGGQPLIFMIGCGHVEKGSWAFQSFTVDSLTEEEESHIINRWFAHMESVQNRVDPHGANPLIIHWSPAEVSNFETAYNSAKERHRENNWPLPSWFDFRRKVIVGAPVVVRGALETGLKAIAQALHQHGLVETVWKEGPTDGLGAMVGAWWCQEEATRKGISIGEVNLMKEISKYNEVDCKVMMEITRYLRKHH